MTAFGRYDALRAKGDVGYQAGMGEPTIAGSTIARLRPIRLLLHNLGPFRGPEPTAIRFVAPRPRIGPAPFPTSDVLVICGDNGTGKSSLLDAIHGLFSLLSSRPTGIFSGAGDGAAPRTTPAMSASARLDMLAVCTIDGHARRVLMTLWHGGEQPPVVEGDADDPEGAADRSERVMIGFSRGSALAAGTNEAGLRILRAVRAAEGGTLLESVGDRGIGAEFAPLPTAIQFRHGRSDLERSTGSSIGGIVYGPAKRFDLGEAGLAETARRLRQVDHTSLRHLFEEIRDGVFLESHATSDLALITGRRIKIDRSKHRRHELEGLGAGEIALFTIQANAWLQMTASALVMIEDLDASIARRWHEKICVATLRLALGRAGAMIVMTTRDARFAATIATAASELGLSCAITHLSDGVV